MELRFLSICHNYVKLHHSGKLKPYRQCHVYSAKPYCPRENWLLSEALEVWQIFSSLSSDDTSAMVQNWSPRQTVCQQVQSMASMIPTASRVPSRTGRVHSNTTYAVWMLPVRALGNLEHLCIACKENKCIFLKDKIDEAYIVLHSAELTNFLPTPSVAWLAIRTGGGCGPRATSTLEHRE